MKTRILMITLSLLLATPWLIEARSPSPWMSYAQGKNKAKNDRQETLKKLNQSIKKTEAARQKNRSRTTPDINKNKAGLLTGGG